MLFRYLPSKSFFFIPFIFGRDPLSPGVSAVFLFMVEGLRKIGSVKELKLNGDAGRQIENEIDYSKIESMVHSFL